MSCLSAIWRPPPSWILKSDIVRNGHINTHAKFQLDILNHTAFEWKLNLVVGDMLIFTGSSNAREEWCETSFCRISGTVTVSGISLCRHIPSSVWMIWPLLRYGLWLYLTLSKGGVPLCRKSLLKSWLKSADVVPVCRKSWLRINIH